MKQQLEVNWAVFLLLILLIVAGLLTGFRFDESLDIQLHDTYIVIHNVQVLISTGIVLVIAYFITFGLKQIATSKSTFRITSTLVAGFIGLGLTIILVLTTATFITIPLVRQNISNYGIVVLLLGLTILFVLRTREIWKVRQRITES